MPLHPELLPSTPCQLGTSRATRAAFLKGGNGVGSAAEQKRGRSSGLAYRAGEQHREKSVGSLISLSLYSFCMHYRFSEALSRSNGPSTTFLFRCTTPPMTRFV